jgi:hypothetical protein
MGVFAGPNTVKGNLSLAVDFQSPRNASLDRPKMSDHGISDWYCFENGTASYSAPYPGTTIYEINGSTETVIVSTTSAAQRGTFSVTAGRRYYGTKAIHLYVNAQDHRLVPLSLSGNYFGAYANRATPSTYYLYSPYQNTTIDVYDARPDGIFDSAYTQQISLNQDSNTTYVTSTSGSNNWTWFVSAHPIVMTKTGSSDGDRIIMSPAGYVEYRRFDGDERHMNNTAPTTINTSHVSSTTHKVKTITIADGSGFDAVQGLKDSDLYTRCAFNGNLPDFYILSPTSQTVNVYHESSGSWTLDEAISLSTGTNVFYAGRDGNNGFDSAGGTFSGAAASLGDYLWKWEADNPFMVVVNDNGDDEKILLGWDSDRHNRLVSNQDTSITDLANSSRTINMTMYNRSQFADSAGVKFFRSRPEDYLYQPSQQEYMLKLEDNLISFADQDPYTFEFWCRLVPGRDATFQTLTGIGTSVAPWLSVYPGSGTFDIRYRQSGGTYYNTSTLSHDLNNWTHIVASVDTSRNVRYYIDGLLKATVNPTTTLFNVNRLGGGYASGSYRYSWQGDIAVAKIHTKTFSADEAAQNYEALKVRFGH